jgi:DNA-binding FadR family transcriptional regulator
MDNQDLRLDLEVIDTSSLVDKVETRLIEVFLYRELKPGESIPKETELATLMGVSRTVIRESLNRLKTMGLIESKKHMGTIIKSPDLSVILRKSIIPRILDSKTLMNIFEIRLALEVGMSDFIFSRKRQLDIDELTDLVECDPDHSEGMLFDINHELKFHGKLHRMSGNDTLKDFMAVLFPAFLYVYSSGMLRSKGKRKKNITHKGLVSLLTTGTAEEFRNGMRMHLENHFQRILEETPANISGRVI